MSSIHAFNQLLVNVVIVTLMFPNTKLKNEDHQLEFLDITSSTTNKILLK